MPRPTPTTRDEDYDGLVVFKNYVENASNGRIAVELFIGTQLCATGEECLQGISDGSIDIYISTSGGAAGLFPYIQVLDLPYLMSDDRVAETVLSGDFTRKLREKALADSDGTIRLMTIGNTGGWRDYANTKGPVKSPADLAGLKMRTVPADLPQQIATAVGAAPTPIAWPELFTSLQTGVVEGTANGITDIMNMKFPDAGLKYLTLDNHSYMGAFCGCRTTASLLCPKPTARWSSTAFPPCSRQPLLRPSASRLPPMRSSPRQAARSTSPTDVEKAEFKAAVEPVFAWFKSNVAGGQEVFDDFSAAVAEAQTQVDADRAADLN